jgi:hypothetical protein
MVAQDYSGLSPGLAQKPRKSSRALTIASLAAAAVLLAVGVVVVFSGRPAAVELRDVDDDAFFNTGKSLASVGDKELGLADAAMKKQDLHRAQKYAEHAAKAYRYTHSLFSHLPWNVACSFPTTFEFL